jgi:hypothetical protein
MVLFSWVITAFLLVLIVLCISTFQTKSGDFFPLYNALPNYYSIPVYMETCPCISPFGLYSVKLMPFILISEVPLALLCMPRF